MAGYWFDCHNIMQFSSQHIRKCRLAICALILALVFISSPAFSQRDPADRDIRGEVAEKMEEIPKPAPKIKEEEEEARPVGPKIEVSKIELVGVESFNPDIFQPITEKYEGRGVTRVELDTLAQSIQRDYLKRGVIAACYIPPQDVKDGVITLQVVEAKMGELIVRDHDYFDPDRLKTYWPIRPGETLRYDEMSRSLQIMNSNPDRELKATLTAGEKPQTTDVILDVFSQFPIHITASIDTEGNTTTGKMRKTIGIRDNNFLFSDDTLIAGYSYGTYSSNIYFYHRVPITNFGTTMMYGYSYSKSSPKKDQQYLGLTNLSQNASIFFYQSYYHKNEYIGEFHLGLDAKDKTVKMTSGVLNRDRFRVIRFGSKFRVIAWGGVSYLSPEISQGINGLGARRKNIFSSRKSGVDDGVENTYTIFKMNASHKRRLPLDMQLSWDFKCQVSSEKLASQEEFPVGGINSVRGYPSGDFSADDAFQSRLELLFPAFFIPGWLRVPYGASPIRNEVTGLLFFDYAHAERKGVLDSNVASGEKRIVDDASIGAGVRIQLFNQALLRLEWGFPIGGDRAITETAASRLHFALDFEDKLPGEIARIRKEAAENDIKEQSWAILNGEVCRHGSLLGATLRGYLRKAKMAQAKGDLLKAK
ncbi:MAG: BamA/TamA family outer membrane protein, partial [Candidatus Omnitrophica bacterium]|nr:BamA/TamA family outer membrane protein [Candidatus Omnitrophota bacterium]MBU1851589.1 BamA/TamA family outer membrane protein [Candidatus Omnitrophota bacterium]